MEKHLNFVDTIINYLKNINNPYKVREKGTRFDLPDGIKMYNLPVSEDEEWIDNRQIETITICPVCMCSWN